MRRIAGTFLLLSLMVATMVLVGFQPLAVAQEATPGAESMTEEGVTFEPIGFADGVELPSPASLIALQVTIEPGAVSSFDDTDPTSGLLLVESGEFTAALEASLAVTRGESPFGETEEVAAGEEVTVGEGDAVFIPGSVAGEIRNDGDVPAGGTVFLIVAGDLSAME